MTTEDKDGNSIKTAPMSAACDVWLRLGILSEGS